MGEENKSQKSLSKATSLWNSEFRTKFLDFSKFQFFQC